MKGKKVKKITDIPFLPIEFFKQEKIICKAKPIEKIFLSSGTTGNRSKHLVSDLSMYKTSFRNAFTQFYGNVKDYCILALLPSYLENEDSSLIYMVNDLIKRSNHQKSGFYIDNLKNLFLTIKDLEQKRQKTILFGLTYALIDFAKQYPIPLKHTIIMETGGMKGKRKKLLKEEVHAILKSAFELRYVHSEYGMAEILSQAYSKKEGIFKTPSWMKVIIRDITDPFSFIKNKTGGINIIDLANIYSCPFIATQDLGKVFNDGSFSVLGRLKDADIRGCNLLIQ